MIVIANIFLAINCKGKSPFGLFVSKNSNFIKKERQVLRELV
jgi:hypothetical protein